MFTNLIRGMRRSLACVMFVACMPFPPLLAGGEETPEAVVDLESQGTELKERPAGRSSACRWFALGTLFFSFTTACLGVLLPDVPAVEPIQPLAGTDGGLLPDASVMAPTQSWARIDPALSDLDLVFSSTASGAPPALPARSRPTPSNGGVTCGVKDLPKPRTFRLVRNPKKSPKADALQEFSQAACKQFHSLRLKASWAVAHHLRDQRLLVEGIQHELSDPALADLLTDEEASHHIIDMWIKFRGVLGRHRCFELRKGNPRQKTPYGEDPIQARQFILELEADLNAVYKDFLAFAQRVIERDSCRIEVVDAAKRLNKAMNALEKAGI